MALTQHSDFIVFFKMFRQSRIHQFLPPIALHTDRSHITTELWEYQCCGWRINFTYDYIALLFGVTIFPVLQRAPCKGVMRKACRASDAWREKCKRRLAGENADSYRLQVTDHHRFSNTFII